MKHIYTLLVACAAATLPSAGQNAALRTSDSPASLPKSFLGEYGQPVKADLDQWRRAIPKTSQGGSVAELISSFKSPADASKADLKATNENINSFTWAAMDGKAKFHEDFGNVIFNLGVQDYETPILYATNAAETYALGPFNSSYPYYQDIKSAGYASSQAGYLWLHADDHSYVTFPIFATGWLWADGNPIYMASAAWVMEFEGHDPELVKNAGLGGINESGHIYFPCINSVVWTMDGEDWYTCDDDGQFGFALPGVEVSDEDNQIELSLTGYCFDNNEVTVHMKAGRNIKLFKYGFYMAFTEDMFDDVIEGGTGGEYVAEGDITLDLAGDVKGNSRIWFAVVAGDSQGNIKDAQYLEIPLVPNDDEDWVDAGTCKMTEGIVHHIYNGIESETITCPYQYHKDNPGYIRIVNPYAYENGWTPNSWIPGMFHEHNHYIFIDATDPTAVVLEHSPLGLTIDSDSGEAAVTSEAHESMKYEGKTLAQVKSAGLTGKMDSRSRTITFPKNSIWYAEHAYNNGQWYKTNKTGNLAFDLSDQSGVNIIESDTDADAIPEYYTLQGIRIDAPAEGQVYILRQGTKTTKAIR